MTEDEQMTAWNNLVMHAAPSAFEPGDARRAAAIAALYMGGANSGGLNSFLTSFHDLDAQEVLSSLETLGASVAADQLRHVLDELGDPLPAMSEEERWDRLEASWSDALDPFDALTIEADRDLVAALERHVSANPDAYLKRSSDGAWT